MRFLTMASALVLIAACGGPGKRAKCEAIADKTIRFTLDDDRRLGITDPGHLQRLRESLLRARADSVARCTASSDDDVDCLLRARRLGDLVTCAASH